MKRVVLLRTGGPVVVRERASGQWTPPRCLSQTVSLTRLRGATSMTSSCPSTPSGKPPISIKCVDTDKTHGSANPMVRPRWVARDSKRPHEKDREDLFSATPPIELIRFKLSRQAPLTKDGLERKTMNLDMKKAHLALRCDVYMYICRYA